MEAGREMGRRIVKSLPQHELAPESPDDFLARYSGTKRLRYANALDYVSQYGLPPWSGKITMFVKNESFHFLKKRNPDPRAIQFRDPTYSAQLALHLKPIEHEIYRTKLYGKYYGVGRVIGKGLNMDQRAKLIARKFANIDNCVVVSIDAKRFDLHVSRDLLELEHAYYMKFSTNREFRRLLAKQLRNRCSTRSGYSYTLEGGRMSGDMNTGLGNCVISLIMFKALAKKLRVRMDVLIDGDDTLIFISSTDLAKLVEALESHYLAFGMEMEIAEVATTLEDVDWCQTRPVRMPYGYRMIREPKRTLSNVLVSKKWQPHRQQDYMAAIAMCEMALNRGVPILQEMAMAMWRNSSQTPNLIDSERKEALFSRVLSFQSWDKLVARGMDPRPITQETRESFQKAFGISASEQISWEQYLSEWKCAFGPPIPVESVWDPTSWCPTSDAPIGYYDQ